MSESDAWKVVTAWVDWHLTPKGWVSGSSRDEDGKVSEKTIPEDRVLTDRYSTKGSEMMGKLDKTTERWRSEDATAVAKLLKKYGPSPKTFWL